MQGGFAHRDGHAIVREIDAIKDLAPDALDRLAAG